MLRPFFCILKHSKVTKRIKGIVLHAYSLVFFHRCINSSMVQGHSESNANDFPTIHRLGSCKYVLVVDNRSTGSH